MQLLGLQIMLFGLGLGFMINFLAGLKILGEIKKELKLIRKAMENENKTP
jgi:hypothetical protein